MDFDRLLDDVTALINERGRVSLGAVAQYFDLAPSLLDAVRDELVEARQSVRLENGRIFVALDAKRSPDAAAERRNLTVMFVDLVGSTRLAGRLDPEDLREVVRQYQLAVTSATERFHGYTAQYLGDGLLIYFGYPHAHGDDPRRALFAAHAIMDQMPPLNVRLNERFGVELALRIGVHTGLVVIGDVGAGERHEALALGNTPNVAARLEAAAQPDTIYVSELTRALLGDQFELEDLGAHQLKGVDESMNVFRSIRVSGVDSAFDASVKHKLLPLAGRRDELAQLDTLWQRACERRGSALLVSGDAGIGKSRLIQALKNQLSDADQRWTALRASPYDANTPLLPVITLLRQTIGIEQSHSPAANYARIEKGLARFNIGHAHAARVIASLCGVEPDDAKTPVDLRIASQIFETLFIQMMEEGPRLLVVEDLHWLDPTSMALIRRLIEQVGGKSMLVLVSARSQFDLATLGVRDMPTLRLGPLPEEDVGTMIDAVALGFILAPEVRDEIIQRTDGVPAFVEELTRMLLASEWLVERDDQLVPNGPAPDNIPVTLKDSLMARLDRLGDAKVVAQEAAVIGRTFTAQLLGAVSDMDAAKLDQALTALCDAQVIRSRSRLGTSTTWRFRHALLQEAAYQSLLRATRQTLHQKIALALESQFQVQAAQQPERVARHFTLGGDSERALGYWQWAAEQAVEKAAMKEALAHVGEAMQLLQAQPASSMRDQRELALLSIQGSATVLIGGWAAEGLAQIYQRALALVGRDRGKEHVDFQVLGGLCAYHLVRGEMDTVSLLADRLLRQGAASRDRSSLAVAHVCLCFAGFFRCRFDEAAKHAREVELHYDPDARVPVSFLYGQDPAVITDTVMAIMTWAQGDTRGAMAISERAIVIAKRVTTPFSTLWANAWHARLLFETGQLHDAHVLADVTARDCERKGYAYVAGLANLVAGAAAIAMNTSAAERDAGLERVRSAMRSFNQNPNVMAHTYFNTLSAWSEIQAGDVDVARQVLRTGLEISEGKEDHFFRSELLRLSGELVLASDPDAACVSLVAAIDDATSIGAYRLALRAALGLHRMSEDGSEQRALASRELVSALAGISGDAQDADVLAARELI